MANIYRNIHLRGLNGVGGDQAVYCTTRSGKTIFLNGYRSDGNWKHMSMSIPKRHPGAIRAAAAYAGFAKTQDVYLERECASGVSAYTIALADWFGPPKVLQIDLDAWSGQIGQVIRVKARDNVMVAAVTVVIRDAQKNFLEMGEAVPEEAGSAWWTYTTQSLVEMEPFPIVSAIAQDLPGNRDVLVIC